MAHNDEAGGSGGKAFWELSQEMEEQPHLYEAAAENLRHPDRGNLRNLLFTKFHE
jgi:hypothetical protein